MNERLKELYRQAADYAYTDANPNNGWKNGKDFNENVNEKFAELIVRECAKFLDENSGYDDSNNAWHPEPEDLLEHFGVEE